MTEKKKPHSREVWHTSLLTELRSSVTEQIAIICLWGDALKRMHHHFCGIPDNTTKQPGSKQETTSDKPKLRDFLQNN